MIVEKIYAILEKIVGHPTNKEYASNQGILWFSQYLAILVFGIALTTSIGFGYPLKTMILLPLATGIGTFLVLYLPMIFGRWTLKNLKSIYIKKAIVVFLFLLCAFILVLPFIMVHISGFE